MKFKTSKANTLPITAVVSTSLRNDVTELAPLNTQVSCGKVGYLGIFSLIVSGTKGFSPLLFNLFGYLKRVRSL